MDTAAIKPGIRVRFIWNADELIAKGVDLSAARGTVTGTVVLIEGEARRELEQVERSLRSNKGLDKKTLPREALEYRPTRDSLVAILRDDAVPGNRYQFAAPADLLPEVPGA